MSRPNTLLISSLSLCLITVLDSCVHAQDNPVTITATQPGPTTIMLGQSGVMAGRATVLPAKNQQGPAAVAAFIHAQPPGSRLNLALISPPSLAEIVALLPGGTVFKGNVITLPNTTEVAIIKAKSDKEYEVEFLAHTSSRNQIMASLESLPKGAKVSMKEPGGGTVIVEGDLTLAIKIVSSLPSGTLVTAGAPNSATLRYPRIE